MIPWRLTLVLALACSVKAQILCYPQSAKAGLYLIVSVMSDGHCLDKDSGNDDRFHFQSCNGTDWQKFEIGEADSYGCYAIRPYNARYLIMVPEGSNSPVVATRYESSTAGRWWLVSTGNNHYELRVSSFLVPSSEHRCLDRRYGQDDEPQAIRCVGVDQQNFRLVRLGDLPKIRKVDFTPKNAAKK
jgi:hypothetical protein